MFVVFQDKTKVLDHLDCNSRFQVFLMKLTMRQVNNHQMWRTNHLRAFDCSNLSYEVFNCSEDLPIKKCNFYQEIAFKVQQDSQVLKFEWLNYHLKQVLLF